MAGVSTRDIQNQAGRLTESKDIWVANTKIK